jgi:hypothetical protein
VQQIAVNNEVIIYPNPSNGELFIKNQGPENYQVKLFNELGQQLLETTELTPFNEGYTISLNDFSTGLYLLELSNGHTKTIKKVSLIR